MYKIVDAESRAYALGVRHGDVHPRNIILETGVIDNTVLRNEGAEDENKLVDPTLHLRLFDFGEANLAPFEAGRSDLVQGQWDKAVSPILRWHLNKRHQRCFEEAGWVDWDWQEWLKECWGDSNFYEPITKDAEAAWLLPYLPRVLS